MATIDDVSIYQIAPHPSDPNLARNMQGVDEHGKTCSLKVIEERPLTIYLNSQEVVTSMTIGDYPQYLALGFLKNQGMLTKNDNVTGIDFDQELSVVVVRTESESNLDKKMEKRTRTSGCAVGTIFGDMLDTIKGLELPHQTVKTSWLYNLSKVINRTPSLYLSAGAIHGTVLCFKDSPLIYMEDVGRHNAVDKVSGWMSSEGIPAQDKILYTTGRLTSEMVIKTAVMGIPVLVSRSGFTAWGVDLAREVGLTLIGRLRGRRFMCLSGSERLVTDLDPDIVPMEEKKYNRKGSNGD